MSAFDSVLYSRRHNSSLYTREDAINTINQRWHALNYTTSKFVLSPDYFRYYHLTPSLQSGLFPLWRYAVCECLYYCSEVYNKRAIFLLELVWYSSSKSWPPPPELKYNWIVVIRTSGEIDRVRVTSYVDEAKKADESKPILCGIVALSMISSVCVPSQTAEELLRIAQSLGYTRYGEMFSAYSMLSLIQNSSVKNTFMSKLYDGGLAIRRAEIINLIMDGALLLIPYDADRDHSPGLFGGHKAHWAVICGLILDGADCLLVGRQGKSRHPTLWPIDQLDSSNLNLYEIDPQRLSSSKDYVIENIASSLRGMYIVLTPKSCSNNK